jgi:hypothetical protein
MKVMTTTTWLVGCVLALASGSAWPFDPPRPAGGSQPPPASEPARQTPPAAAPAAPQEEAPPKKAANEPEETETLPPAPPATGPTKQHFEPSEKIRADFPVSFPADI